jgi:hypothetical protein
VKVPPAEPSPEGDAIMASNQGTVAPDLPFPFLENGSFRMLPASLRYFSVNREVRSVLITPYGNLRQIVCTSV